MFGFLVGGLSLLGLFKLNRFQRYHANGGHRKWMFRRLFQFLDTTPGQEKVIAQAAEEIEKAARSARDTFFQSRQAVAGAVKGEHFDSAAVDGAFEKQQAAVDEVKKAVKAGLASIHEALSPEQRAKAAELLEYGPRAAMHGCHGHGRFLAHAC